MKSTNKIVNHRYMPIFFLLPTIILATTILGSCGGKKTNADAPSASSSTTTTEKAPAKWTEVYTFKGNGMKKSPTFELSGGEAKIKYSYKGNANVGMGMFAAYVVEAGKDIMKDGGIPDVMTQAVSEESETSIQKDAGKYYLYINASGDWTVTVEEMK